MEKAGYGGWRLFQGIRGCILGLMGCVLGGCFGNGGEGCTYLASRIFPGERTAVKIAWGLGVGI